jgi:hypothetical protein
MRVNWLKSASEPRLDEILSDPITKALMRSDGLDADQVRLVAIAARRKGVGERRLQEDSQDSERDFGDSSRISHRSQNRGSGAGLSRGGELAA